MRGFAEQSLGMPPPTVIQPRLSNAEFNSLHDFYNATNGPFWRYHNVSINSVPWNFSIPKVNPCKADWQGLVCSCGLTSCSVSKIFLDHHNLTGFLPDSLKNFQQMKSFVLRGNNITGTITASIGNMTELEELDLSYNKFFGEIPSSIGHLTKLKTLNLATNQLTKIPETLYDLYNLEALDLALNKVTSSISSGLGNLTRLQTLQLQGNDLTGVIPETIGNLQSLVTIDLGDTLIRGSLPKGFYNLLNLTSCVITSCQISGTISPDIGNLINLRSLELSYNSISRTIPSEIGNLINLNTLMLNNNALRGPLPSTFSNLINLKLLFLSSNILTGEVEFLGNLTLTLLDLNQNNFHGKFPMYSSLFQSLLFLDISENSFTGPMPWCEDFDNPILTWFRVNTNFFTGTLPQIAQTPKLRYFLTQENVMTGSIPINFLDNSTDLYYLSTYSNYFTGTIPDSIGIFHRLNQIDFNNNYLYGEIPNSFGGLVGLVVIHVDENLLSGTIPFNFTNLHFIQELMLQNNYFTGSLDQLLNITNHHFMTNIDVSGNLFTGSLPEEFFIHSTLLSSFAAGSNCLTGEIPEAICQAETIVSLTLDGLTTAENCRQYLFSDLSSQFTGFIVNHYLGSTIPNCLFEMPMIELLHLSGNGFSGTIPSTLNISTTLTDLSLSYNSLEGTIPNALQDRNWYSLDLSYNKLTGTLHNNLYSRSLSLEVNRLSGKIPSNVLNAVNISILDGNIFQCNTLETDLPTNDPYYSKYSCGSDSTNDVLYAWLSALFLVPVLIMIVWRFGYKLKLSMGTILHQCFVWKNALNSDDPNRINLLRLSIYFDEVRKAVLIISLYSMIVLVPIYLALTYTSPSYTFQYAWSISAMLVKGQTAAIALFLSLFVVVVMFFSLIQNLLEKIDRKAPSPQTRNSSVSRTSRSTTEENKSYPIITGLTYLIVSLLNLVVMGAADFSYVYIILNYSTLIISLSAFTLAIFRLITNNIILWSALPQTLKWLLKIRYYSCNNLSKDNVLSSTDYTALDIHFLENLILFNNILIPGFAIVFTLPDCFYNALFASDVVSSSYDYLRCEQYIAPTGRGHICYDQTRTIYYDPPYIYNFQCSSKIVINYVVVYVIMFILAGLIIPLMKVSLKLLYDKLKHDDKIEETTSSISSQSSLSITPAEQRKSLNLRSWLKKMVRGMLPQYFKDFRLNSEDNNSESSTSLTKSRNAQTLSLIMSSIYLSKGKGNNKILFSKLSLTVHINSYLTILMCFGVLFPPLAVITAISICSVTYFEELCIGWVLTETRRLGAGFQWYEEQLERECAGVEESSNLTIWSTLVVSCGLYGYMIFDTMGDELGWKAALPITLLMVLMPLILTLGKRVQNLLTPKQSNDNAENNELNNANIVISIKNEVNIRQDSVIELTSVSDYCNPSFDVQYIVKNPLLV